MAGFNTLLAELLGSAVSALNAIVLINNNAVQKCQRSVIYVIFGAGTSAGTFVVEEAPYEGYTGTWAVIATLAWAAVTSVKSANIQGPHGALRIRCSVAMVGGTADVYVRVLA